MLIVKGHRKLLDDELDKFMWDDTDAVFIKLYSVNGRDKWVVYSSDGSEIAEVDSREQAFVVARQNNFHPCSAH